MGSYGDSWGVMESQPWGGELRGLVGSDGEPWGATGTCGGGVMESHGELRGLVGSDGEPAMGWGATGTRGE